MLFVRGYLCCFSLDLDSITLFLSIILEKIFLLNKVYI